MSIANARPTLWSKNILKATKTKLVFGGPGVINRDYEGEFEEAGDTVKILTVGDVKVVNYVKGVPMAAPESLTDADLTLVIDQQKAFNFEIDNIDKRQANVDLMAEASDRAAYGLKKEADTFIAEKWKEIATGNKGSSYKWGTEKTIYEMIVALGVILNKTDTPNDGRRFVVLNPDSVGNLQNDLRFTGYGTTANRQQLEEGLPPAPNGYIGKAAGFNVYESNEVPVETSKYKVVAGHPMGWSFADNLSKVVPYEPHLQFSDALKGLHVYGAKVVRPDKLAYAIAEA